MLDRVYYSGTRFTLKVHPSVEHRVLAIPGSNKRRSGEISLPANLISWHLLKDVDFLLWDRSADDWRAKELEIIEVGQAVNNRSLEVWDQPDLWEWQAQALARLERGSVLLGDDRGMGKTRVVIEAIRASGEGAIVVTSKRLRDVWVRACGLWWDDNRVIAPRDDTWTGAAWQVGQLPITVLTYESLMNEDIHDAASAVNPHWLVLEEAHNMKKRHKQNEKKDAEGNIVFRSDTKSGLIRSLPGKVRIAVSGTPMPNVWHEIWTLLNFVAPDVFTSYWQFVEGIGNVTVNFWGGKEIDIDVHRPEIWDEIFDRWMIVRDRSSDRRTIWDFAPVILSKKEAKAYRIMQEEMRVEMNGQVLDAPNVLAQAIRLQQLAGGLGEWETWQDEEGKTKSSYQHARPSAKLEELIERITGLTRAVIFTRFRNRAEFVADQIEMELGIEVLRMVGGLSEKKQKEYLNRFSDVVHYPHPIVAVCVYGTISEGVNELVASRDILLLDWYTAKDVAQAVDRLDRPGTKHDSIRATVLYAEGTIDELMIDRSSFRVLPLKEILRTPDAYSFLLNPIDRDREE